MPAKILDEVFGPDYFQNKPISMAEFEELYVDADRGRGNACFADLKRQLLCMPDGNLKLLFAGHRGCGKSTELLRLQRDIGNEMLVLNFSVKEELDLININYIELFIVTMEKLFNFFQNEKRITINKQYLENIKDWVSSREIEEVNYEHLGIDIEAGLKSGLDIPFLANFFAKFKTAAKMTTSLKETLKTKVEPKLSELIRNCNNLIDDIKTQLSRINKKGLVIIIEDLDKVDAQKADDIFYAHSPHLTQLNCHCIFTFPIALLYHIRFKPIAGYYNNTFVLPMIKVREKTGQPCTEGIGVMKAILKNRIDLSLFEEDEIITDMIKISGGCIWDLFSLVREASHSTLNAKRSRINRGDYTSAYNWLKNTYERTIAENREKGIKVNEYYDTLVACARDKEKKLSMTDAMLDLMYNLTVLSYNGDNWYDVHPIVRDMLRERRLLGDE